MSSSVPDQPFASRAKATFPNVSVERSPEAARTLIRERRAAEVQIVKLAAPGVKVELNGKIARENGLERFVKFAWQLDGAAEIQSTAGDYMVRGGEAMLLPLSDTYRYEADPKHEALFLIFGTRDRPSWQALVDRRPLLSVKPGSASAAALAGIASLMRHADGSQGDAVVVEACLEMMLHTLLGEAAEAGAVAESILLRKATLLIEENIGDPSYGPEQLAEALGRSRRSLYKDFEALGLSPGRFMQQLRLSRARSEITRSSANRVSLTETALKYGFADSSSFSHAFRRSYGVAPSALRRR